MSSDEEHPDPMTAFMKKFKDTLEDLGANKHINVPQFQGKNGKDPIDHCLKVDDYFKAAKIAIADQREHFKDTLFEKARRWENTLADTLNRYCYIVKFWFLTANSLNVHSLLFLLQIY